MATRATLCTCLFLAAYTAVNDIREMLEALRNFLAAYTAVNCSICAPACQGLFLAAYTAVNFATS